MKSHLIILTPVYEDWSSLSLLLDQIDRHLEGSDITTTLLVVDDALIQKPSGQLFRKYRAIVTVKVLRLKVNMGHQRAIRTVACDRAPRLAGKSKMGGLGNLILHGLGAISVYNEIFGVRCLIASIVVMLVALGFHRDVLVACQPGSFAATNADAEANSFLGQNNRANLKNCRSIIQISFGEIHSRNLAEMI